MKSIKKILIPTLGAVAAISLASCGFNHVGTANDGVTKNEDGTFTVRVGNTNATGLAALATVFGPMDYGMKAYAWYYGQYENEGKVKIDYKHLDDSYTPAIRAANTDTLLNQEKCFGIVYSYEDQATLLDQTNKVEVYTPLTKAYYQESGDPVASFPIQPIDYTEGEHLFATAFGSVKKGGLGAKKVGIIAGTSATGNDQVESMKAEAKRQKKVENTDFFIQRVQATDTDTTAQVTALKNAGCEVVILTDVSGQFLNAVEVIANSHWSGVTMLASYKLSNAYYLSQAYVKGAINDGRRLLTTGWIAAGIENPETFDDWANYVKALTLYSKAQNDGYIATVATETAKGAAGAPEVVQQLVEKYDWAKDGVSSYFYDSYAMAGYEGMYVFGEGLTRLYNKGVLEGASTEDYVKVMEDGGMNIPMSTVKVDLKNGRRTGAQAFTLVEVTAKNFTLGEPARTFKTTADLR